MRHLGSLGEMAIALIEADIVVREAQHKGLVRIGEAIERTAKADIGHYQTATGPFPEWPELADSTKEDRIKQGYSENDPLERSGDFKETFDHETSALETVIGTPDERGPWFEFGTSKMPARPVLGPAAFRNKDKIAEIIGVATVSGLVGADQIHKALGYDFETEG